jgi:hypothetical protein
MWRRGLVQSWGAGTRRGVSRALALPAAMATGTAIGACTTASPAARAENEAACLVGVAAISLSAVAYTVLSPPQAEAGPASNQTDNPLGMAGNATVAQLQAALPKALVVDVRSVAENHKGPSVPGALNLVWDRQLETMPLDGLPQDKSLPLFVH